MARSKEGHGAQLIATGVRGSGALAATGDDLYVVAKGSEDVLDLAVARVSKSGRGACVLLPAPWDKSPGLRIRADGSGLYVNATNASDLGGDALWWLARDGQSARLLLPWRGVRTGTLHLGPRHVVLAFAERNAAEETVARLPKP